VISKKNVSKITDAGIYRYCKHGVHKTERSESELQHTVHDHSRTMCLVVYTLGSGRLRQVLHNYWWTGISKSPNVSSCPLSLQDSKLHHKFVYTSLNKQAPYGTASRLLVKANIRLLKVENPKFEGHVTPNDDKYQKSVGLKFRYCP